MVPSPSAAAAGNVVNFDAAEYSYTLPDTLVAGPVTLVMRNVGKEAHHAQFLKLNTGVTLDQFIAVLQQGEGPALALVSFQSGTGALDPGSNTESVSVFSPVPVVAQNTYNANFAYTQGFSWGGALTGGAGGA